MNQNKKNHQTARKEEEEKDNRTNISRFKGRALEAHCSVAQEEDVPRPKST